MAKLGSKKRPLILRVANQEDGERAMQICDANGWHYIIGVEPEKRTDLSDLDKALRARPSGAGSDEERDLSGVMIPLYEVLPDLARAETRSITILHEDGPLPRGEYGFVEFYCADPSCDCRRVLFQVFRGPENPRPVATVNYAFDEPSPDDPEPRTFLDPLGPQSDLSDLVLAAFETILLADEAYVRRLETHYARFKEAVAEDGIRRRLVAPRGAMAARSARSPKARQSAEQKERRTARGEQTFLFDAEVTRCLGEVERARWDRAIAAAGGSVARAAEVCGLPGIPKNAKALHGKSVEEAMGTYRRWKKQRR